MTVQLKTLKREIPAMLIVALLLWPVLRDLRLELAEGISLLVVFTALLLLVVCLARKEARDKSYNARNTQYTMRMHNTKKSTLFVVVGLVGLALGADMVVRGAVVIGERIGLSEAVIGLTIIAVGTSLPELVTCVVASIKGRDDISIGNLVGSNVFNTLLVTGTASVISPFQVSARLAGADYWILVIVSGAFVVMALIGKLISRIEGAILVCAYLAYMVYLLGFTASV